MSIFEKIFGSAAPAPQQPQQQPAAAAPQPGNMNPAPAGTAASTGTDPNGTVPAGSSAAPAKPESPLDKFNELWQPPTDASQGATPLLSVDPKQIAEAARKTDFAKMISPEQLTAITAGGEGAAAAFAQALNQVAQGVYAQSAFATTKIVEQAVSKARDQFNADIPNHVKKLQVSDTLRNDNPAFNHPAAAPILGAIEAQITTKYPNASATEITSLAKQYLENFANVINAPATAAEAAKAAKNSKDTDWSTFIQ